MRASRIDFNAFQKLDVISCVHYSILDVVSNVLHTWSSLLLSLMHQTVQGNQTLSIFILFLVFENNLRTNFLFFLNIFF